MGRMEWKKGFVHYFINIFPLGMSKSDAEAAYVAKATELLTNAGLMK